MTSDQDSMTSGHERPAAQESFGAPDDIDAPDTADASDDVDAPDTADASDVGDAPGDSGATGIEPADGNVEAQLPPDIAQLSYEAARDQLVDVVRKLESGQSGLEESIALWERGEMLARRCQQWLDGARERLDQAVAARQRDG